MNPNRKPKINYPCTWPYKVIGADRELIPQLIRIYLNGRDYRLRESNHSKTGKYTSFLVSTTVESEKERNAIYILLKNIPTVRMVL